MAELSPPRGLYFEEYNVGDTITTQGRTITETDVVNFAALSGDWNPLHTDAEAARASSFGERIAHGLLVLSVATGLAERLGFMQETVIAFMGLEWQFRGAVKIGDTVRVEAVVSELKLMRRLGGGYVALKIKVRNQEEEVVQRGVWTILVRSRPEEEQAEGVE